MLNKIFKKKWIQIYINKKFYGNEFYSIVSHMHNTKKPHRGEHSDE